MSVSRVALAALSGVVSASLLVAAAWSLPGCDPAQQQKSTPCACESASPVVDASLMAFLSRARVLHREADAAETEHDVPKAIAALERIVNGPLPNGSAPPPEAREVLADTRARLAELRAEQNDFDKATSDIEAGLKLVPESSYYRGHLFEVLGGIEERRAGNAEKAGDTASAKAARERALNAGEQAVKIQEEVINRVTEKGAPR